MDIDPWNMDRVGVELAGFNNFLNFHDTDLAASCGRLVEIAGCFAEDRIAGRISFPGFDDGEVSEDAFFEYVILAIERLNFFALRYHGADTRLGIEAGNARAARAHALG